MQKLSEEILCGDNKLKYRRKEKKDKVGKTYFQSPSRGSQRKTRQGAEGPRTQQHDGRPGNSSQATGLTLLPPRRLRADSPSGDAPPSAEARRPAAASGQPPNSTPPVEAGPAGHLPCRDRLSSVLFLWPRRRRAAPSGQPPSCTTCNRHRRASKRMLGEVEAGGDSLWGETRRKMLTRCEWLDLSKTSDAARGAAGAAQPPLTPAPSRPILLHILSQPRRQRGVGGSGPEMGGRRRADGKRRGAGSRTNGDWAR